MSSSGRYQSWILTTVRSRSRQLADRLAIAVRSLKTAALWGTQVALYPIYLLFQSGRLVSKQLRQSVQRTVLRFQAQRDPSLQALPPSDQAIQRTLDFVHQFVHQIVPPQPIQQQIIQQAGQEQPSPATSSQPIATLKRTDQSNLAVSKSSGVAVQPASEPVSTLEQVASVLNSLPTVRGIATLLDHRKLVLVDDANQIWDVLTAEQQQRLYQRLIWEVIDYDRTVQRVAQLQQKFSLFSPDQRRLPPPPDRPQAWQFVRRFHRIMAWIQQSPVAIAINLFQEADFVHTPRIYPSPVATTSSLSGVALIDPDAWCNPNHALPQEAMPTEPWLTMADVFGVPENPTQAAITKGKLLTPVLAASPHQVSADDTSRSQITRTSIHALVEDPWTTEAVTEITTDAGTIAPISASTPSMNSQTVPKDSACAVDGSTPDYIDIEAESTGYVKHPLEQILEWLDIVLTWVESLGLALWKFIRHRLSL
ncbi:MAG: hypothetical protein NZ772_03970 [Cyanobacteria bacterium]|nr:hypothetical protein [Cyanobacteriota bacterium]MDW8201267.1 hypothetical protein [Cyanobacteriota bacterium SKYGB_h_bin112]